MLYCKTYFPWICDFFFLQSAIYSFVMTYAKHTPAIESIKQMVQNPGCLPLSMIKPVMPATVNATPAITTAMSNFISFSTLPQRSSILSIRNLDALLFPITVFFFYFFLFLWFPFLFPVIRVKRRYIKYTMTPISTQVQMKLPSGIARNG